VGWLRANATAAFLAVGLLGVACLILGLGWDSHLHAQDPTLAGREGIFTLANPGHVLIGVGIALADAGLVGAAYLVLPLGRWGRRSFLAGAVALMIVAGVRLGYAASAEWSITHPGGSAAHGHDSGGRALAVTGAQLRAAEQLIVETRAAAEKYRDLRVAIQAGYQPMEPPNAEIVHYVNQAYLTTTDVLKPEHVQSLIYYNSTHGPVLIGAMYIMPTLGMPGPQVGGALTSWHHHDDLCFDKTTHMVVAFVGDSFFGETDKSRACPRGSSKLITPEMLHVWLVDNPNGPFDSDMAPEFLRTLIPAASG
jgi:hypothetical protein